MRTYCRSHCCLTDTIHTGEWLFYVDSNVLKHRELLSGAPRLHATLPWLWNRTDPLHDVFVPYEHPGRRLKHFCKTHADRAHTAVHALPTALVHPCHTRLWRARCVWYRHAVRALVRPDDVPRVLEYPTHQTNRMAARKSAASESMLMRWLELCAVRELLEPEPNPVPVHPDFQWHVRRAHTVYALSPSTASAHSSH